MKKRFSGMLSVLLAVLMLLSAPASAFAAIAVEDIPTNLEKYHHPIDISALTDYLYGGSKTTTGQSVSAGYKAVPEEWTRHLMPSSLRQVGKAIIHIGDNDKEGIVRAYFYPGEPPKNYHAQRIQEVKEIGYYPIVGEVYTDWSHANTAFYVYTQTEYKVIAYNDEWVAVWEMGGVDTSRGVGNPCGGQKFAQYASFKPGVYFFKRENCYITDVANQLSEVPTVKASGTATTDILVKTTPDSNDFVKAGRYAQDEFFQVIDTKPINGHYKIYFTQGAYYVESKYVNLKDNSVTRPTLSYTAEVSSTSTLQATTKAGGGSVSGVLTKGASVDVIAKNAGSGYTSIWFNSRKCYVPTKSLTNFVKKRTVSNLSKIGSRIGVVAVDSPWRAYGAWAYSAEGLKLLKKYRMDSNAAYAKVSKLDGGASLMRENATANVYAVSSYTYAPDADYPSEKETVKIYKIVYDGLVRYIVGGYNAAFTYYAGNSYSKKAQSTKTKVWVTGKYYWLESYTLYNDKIYFNVKDLAAIMNPTTKAFNVVYDKDKKVIKLERMAAYTGKGSFKEGDGKKKAVAISPYTVSLNGELTNISCYRINGGDFIQLEDLASMLDVVIDKESSNYYSIYSTKINRNLAVG